MSRIRTNRTLDVNSSLLDGEKELVGLMGSLSVVQITPDWSVCPIDDLRCRVVAMDLSSNICPKITSFLTAEDLDNLIDLLIGVRADIQSTGYPHADS